MSSQGSADHGSGLPFSICSYQASTEGQSTGLLDRLSASSTLNETLDIPTEPLKDLYSKIEEQQKTIMQLNKTMEKLYETVDLLKEEKEVLTSEIRDMSGSLFDEAHRSINEANDARRALEIQIKALRQNELALKLQNDSLKTIIEKRSHKRNKSGTEVPGHTLQPSDLELISPKSNSRCIERQGSPHSRERDLLKGKLSYERNQMYFDEFSEWTKLGCPADFPFFREILQIDIMPCLTFPNREIQEIARNYMESWEGNPTIEIAPTINERICEFTLQPCRIYYFVKFSHHRAFVASSEARRRIIAVVELYNYIRYISLGIVKSSVDEMFLEITRLRLRASMVRLGYFLQDNA